MITTSPPPDRPSPALAGPGPGVTAKRLFLSTRPAFFTASVLPVFVGTAWAAAATGHVDWRLLALALAATVLAHGATNVYNDVGDDVIGADEGNNERIYPYTGGSRFIQTGLLTRAEMARLALGLAVAALVVGFALTLLRGPGVVLLGLAGLALGILYSMPGVQLSARGVGELAVAVGFGPLPLLGAAWLQGAPVNAGAVLVSLPVGAWVAAILLINEVPDRDADARAGKRTLVVRLGAAGARAIYFGLTALALAASAAAATIGALPLWYALPAAALALAGVLAARGISVEPAARPQLRKSIELTLAIHALGSITLCLAILAHRFA
ncbi:MAG TPA: prenyltransferase [Steroidobacteraceae bacterium]|nr:prenyltransferase [Steroidobacteraceae bacterium]